MNMIALGRVAEKAKVTLISKAEPTGSERLLRAVRGLNNAVTEQGEAVRKFKEKMHELDDRVDELKTQWQKFDKATHTINCGRLLRASRKLEEIMDRV